MSSLISLFSVHSLQKSCPRFLYADMQVGSHVPLYNGHNIRNMYNNPMLGMEEKKIRAKFEELSYNS